MLIHFYCRFFLLAERGQCVYELFYKFEKFDSSVLQVTDVLCSFHGIKLLVKCLEVPSCSSEKLTLPEDGFEYSIVLQAFLQLTTRLNSAFISFCVTPGSYLYAEYQEVWNMFFYTKIVIKVDNSFNV